MLCQSFELDDSIEELPALAELHNDVHVAVVYVALVELNDVRVVNLLQDRELFLKKQDVLLDIR